MPRLRILVLGQPVLEFDGVDLTSPLPLKSQALVFYLAAQVQPVTRSRLAALLWSERDEAVARANLRVALSRIRQRLPGCLDVDARQVGLVNRPAQTVHVDLSDLEDALAASGAPTLTPADHARCCRAAQAWRGPFMEGFDGALGEEFERWLLRMRQRTERQVATLRRDLVRHAEAAGTPEGRQEAIGHARVLLDIDDADESAHMLLMRLLAETAQRSAAIAQYEACKAALALRLGARPSPGCYALYTRIHAADDRHGQSVPLPPGMEPVGSTEPADPADPAATGDPKPAPALSVAARQALPLAAELVGRAAELAWLRTANQGATLLIGDAGLGKSALLALAWPQAARLQGRETLATLPLHPWIELLREHRSRLLPHLTAWLPELARLVPDYAAEPPPPFDPVLGKLRLFEALCQVLDLLGMPVVVDDLQWADPLTLEWLGHAVVQRQMPVVMARRPDAVGAELEGLERMLEHAGLLRTRSLPLLDDAAIGQLLRARIDRPRGSSAAPAAPAAGLDAAALQAIVQRAAGNPFFALELWRWHRAAHAAGTDDTGEQGPDAALAVPPRVALAITKRMAWLPEAARRTLGLLAVAADAGLPATALADAAGLPQEEFAAACDRLEKDGFLHGDELAHDLLREAVLQALPPRRRRQWHTEVATALERLGGDTGLAGADHVAQHWRAAGQAQRALAADLRAAQAWRQLGALEESAERCRRIAEQAQDPLLRMRARAAVAEHLLLSDLAAGHQALEALLAETAGLPHSPQRQTLLVRLHTGLADNAIYRGDLVQAALHVDRLHPILDDAEPVERQHALEIVIEVSTRRGDFAQARAALESGRRENPANVTWNVYAAMLAWSEMRLDDAIAGFAQVLRDHPDHARYVMVENDHAVALWARGDVAAAEHWLRRGLTTWAGVPHAQCLSRMNLAAVLTCQGRAQEAAAELHAAHQLALDQHSRLFEGECQHRLGRLQLQCGQAPAARRSLDRALGCLSADQDPVRVAQWRACAALAALADGDLQAARSFMAQALAVPEALHRPLAVVRLLWAQAELALGEGDAAAARTHAERLVEMAGRWCLDEVLADALLQAARCAQLDGRLALVQAHARRALAVAESRGLRPLQWRAWMLLEPSHPHTLALAQALQVSAGSFGWVAGRDPGGDRAAGDLPQPKREVVNQSAPPRGKTP